MRPPLEARLLVVAPEQEQERARQHSTPVKAHASINQAPSGESGPMTLKVSCGSTVVSLFQREKSGQSFVRMPWSLLCLVYQSKLNASDGFS